MKAPPTSCQVPVARNWTLIAMALTCAFLASCASPPPVSGDGGVGAASRSTASGLDKPLVTIEKPLFRGPEPWPVETQGEVVLRYKIDQEGKTSEVEVVRTSHPVWVDAATKMVLGTRYSSPMRGGQRVSVVVDQAFNFRTGP